MLALFGEDLHSGARLEVSFDVGDGGEVVEGGRTDAVENVDFDQFVVFEFDVDGVDAFGTDALDDAHLGRLSLIFSWFWLRLSLVFPELGRSDGQSQVALLVVGHIDLNALADVVLADFY